MSKEREFSTEEIEQIVGAVRGPLLDYNWHCISLIPGERRGGRPTQRLKKRTIAQCKKIQEMLLLIQKNYPFRDKQGQIKTNKEIKDDFTLFKSILEQSVAGTKKIKDTLSPEEYTKIKKFVPNLNESEIVENVCLFENIHKLSGVLVEWS